MELIQSVRENKKNIELTQFIRFFYYAIHYVLSGKEISMDYDWLGTRLKVIKHYFYSVTDRQMGEQTDGHSGIPNHHSNNNINCFGVLNPTKFLTPQHKITPTK